MKYPVQILRFLGQKIRVYTFDFMRSRRTVYNSLTGKEEGMKNASGMFVGGRNEIWLCSYKSKAESRKQTLWHECFHMCSDKGGADMTEGQVQIMSELFYAVVMDNPEVMLPAELLKRRRS